MPVPTPWPKPVTAIDIGPMFRAKPLIPHMAAAEIRKPARRISRLSIRPTSRPTTNIDNRVPMPRGAITSPAVSTG